MATNIVEFFGRDPRDSSPAGVHGRTQLHCPFLGVQCIKTLNDGTISGVCTLKPKKADPVICCPIRLYAHNYRVLSDVAQVAFGSSLPLYPGTSIPKGTDCIAVFGKRWGKELRLPSRAKGTKAGAYFVDWVLTHINAAGELVNFCAIEVQSIDTASGNYRAERAAYLQGQSFAGSSSAGFNWENVSKRILPQVIYKGHVLRREPLCQKGLFFVCPKPVYERINERLGSNLQAYHLQPGSVTLMWYDIASPVPPGQIRDLLQIGYFTTTVDQIALAFTSPTNLPPPQVYEKAIRDELGK